MLKCIIIDDEPHAIEGLKGYIAEMSTLVLLASYVDPTLALKEIQLLDEVDLIFVDVDMPKINGLELAKEIRSKTKKLIFTTAHTKYAYEAFEVKADGYLLKPYSLGKFIITINNLFPAIRQSSVEVANQELVKKDFFFVKSKEDDLKILKIKYAEVIAIESKLNYVAIHLKEKIVLTYMGLKDIAQIFAQMPNFMQLHRSYIINTSQIETIDGNLVKMTNGIRITVGENYRKVFAFFVNQSLIKAGKRE